jgi:hypothetical protein
MDFFIRKLLAPAYLVTQEQAQTFDERQIMEKAKEISLKTPAYGSSSASQ